MKDPQRRFKDIVALSSSLSGIVTKVVGVEKLKKKYKSYESKRLLAEAHDIFLADDRVVTMLPKILGNSFYKKTSKVPIPIVLNGKDTPEQVEKEVKKALSSTYLHLQPAASTSIRVAMSSFTPEQVMENVVAAMDDLTEKRIPGGWRNLKAVHIKSPDSAALPIWMTAELYSEDDVLKPEEEQERAKKEAEKAAERAERKKTKNAKKRKGLSDTPVAEEGSPDKKKARVEEQKIEELAADDESEEDNGMEVLVPGDVDDSSEEEPEKAEPPKKVKSKKSSDTLKKRKSVDDLKSAQKSKKLGREKASEKNKKSKSKA